MAFDYKKEYKEFYLPKSKPGILEVPKIKCIAVRGKGDPNQEDGEYKKAIEILYAIAFTIKMSYKGSYQIEGYFQYVVPPLEGLWTIEQMQAMDYSKKEQLEWISFIRLPDFVSKKDFDWAVKEATTKKKKDFSKAEFFEYEDGCCVQCMHIGSYDKEPATIEAMKIYAEENGYTFDITKTRYHHEIYLSDPRKGDPSKVKTVIRYPIKKKEN